MMDKEDYGLLQKVIRQDIRDSFDDDILPVKFLNQTHPSSDYIS
jgi:hypothetical protein